MAKEIEGGRIAQKRRTRKEIVAAAARLLAKGMTPSMSDVAAEADVSRRTVYMYFPTQEQLLIDASLLSLTEQSVGAVLDALDDERDVLVRVEALARAVVRDFATTEQQGRTLLRLTIDADRSDRPENEPVRGYRRIEWIERALEPARAQLTKGEWERLVSGLAMVIGWESLLVARDIRALDLVAAEKVSVWAALGLVRAALAEARARTRARRHSSRQDP